MFVREPPPGRTCVVNTIHYIQHIVQRAYSLFFASKECLRLGDIENIETLKRYKYIKNTKMSFAYASVGNQLVWGISCVTLFCLFVECKQIFSSEGFQLLFLLFSVFVGDPRCFSTLLFIVISRMSIVNVNFGA